MCFFFFLSFFTSCLTVPETVLLVLGTQRKSPSFRFCWSVSEIDFISLRSQGIQRDTYPHLGWGENLIRMTSALVNSAHRSRLIRPTKELFWTHSRILLCPSQKKIIAAPLLSLVVYYMILSIHVCSECDVHKSPFITTPWRLSRDHELTKRRSWIRVWDASTLFTLYNGHAPFWMFFL